MKTVLKIIAAVAIIAAASGCATKPVSVNDWAADYYKQANTAEILHVEGTNISFTMSGATKLVLSTPTLPKQMMPRDVTWMDSLMDGVKTIAPWVAVGYLGTHGSYTPSTTVKGATTVTLPAATTP